VIQVTESRTPNVDAAAPRPFRVIAVIMLVSQRA